MTDRTPEILAAIADLGERLTTMDERLTTMDERLTAFETAVTHRFDAVDRTLRSMGERLDLIEDKVDRNSGVRFDADRLLTGFARLKQRVDALEGGPHP